MATRAYLHSESVEAVALRVVDVLRSEVVGGRLVDPAELARYLNVSRDYVYAHADALGAVRLGHGSRPLLRFNLAHVLEQLRVANSRDAVRQRGSMNAVRRGREADLLPVKDESQ